jgi:hypothetical protein
MNAHHRRGGTHTAAAYKRSTVEGGKRIAALAYRLTRADEPAQVVRAELFRARVRDDGKELVADLRGKGPGVTLLGHLSPAPRNDGRPPRVDELYDPSFAASACFVTAMRRLDRAGVRVRLRLARGHEPAARDDQEALLTIAAGPTDGRVGFERAQRARLSLATDFGGALDVEWIDSLRDAIAAALRVLNAKHPLGRIEVAHADCLNDGCHLTLDVLSRATAHQIAGALRIGDGWHIGRRSSRWAAEDSLAAQHPLIAELSQLAGTPCSALPSCPQLAEVVGPGVVFGPRMTGPFVTHADLEPVTAAVAGLVWSVRKRKQEACATPAA